VRTILRAFRSLGVCMIMLVSCIVLVAPVASADPSCVNNGVYVLFVRGSGESFNDLRANQFYWSLIGNAQYPGSLFGKVNTAWAELGNLDGDNDSQDRLDSGEYPAVHVDDWHVLPWFYGPSVETGMHELVTHLNDRAARCPNEKTVIGAYSQGADVAGWALRRSDLSQTARNHIAYVALYGDPKFDAGSMFDRMRGIVPWWVRGDNHGFRSTQNSFAQQQGIAGPRSPYISSEFSGRFGSWCDDQDGVCTGSLVDALGGTHGSAYQDRWIRASSTEIADAVTEQQVGYFHGVPPNGAVVENYDGGGHKYVALGGSLIYIPTSENIWDYVNQMQRLYPSGQFHDILRMHNDEIHAMEYGFGGDRVHVPGDNSFFYERGSAQQYDIQYRYSFSVGSIEELDYLGGRDRAIMVPAGIAGRLSGVPAIPNDVMMKSVSDPAVFHEVNGTAFWVPSTPMLDCIRVVKGGGMQPVPGSLLNVLRNAGRLTNQPTNCTFPHGQVLVGQPSGKQAIVLYGSGFAIGSPDEAIAIGAANRAVPVADVTVDDVLGKSPNIPNGHVFRAGLAAATYHYVDQHFSYIPSVGMRDCLVFRGQLAGGAVSGGGNGVEVVPGSFIDKFPKGADAYCTLEDYRWSFDVGAGNRQYVSLFGTIFQVGVDEVAPLGGVNAARPMSHEGTDYLERLNFTIPNDELLRAPGDPRVYHIVDNQLHYVGSPATRDCLSARSGKNVRLVPQDLIDRMRAMGRVGADAACAYEGRLLQNSAGRVDYVQNGSRHHVTNSAIVNCLKGRVGSGNPIPVDDATFNSYADAGTDAYCPYELEPGLNFVQDPAYPGIVWLVGPATGGTPGVRRHAGSLCVNDPYTTPIKAAHVFTVPAHEIDGHVQGPDWWPSSADCQALPQG